MLYIDEGNFLNWYDRREDAEKAVLHVAEQDRAEAEKFGYFTYDDAAASRSASSSQGRSCSPSAPPPDLQAASSAPKAPATRRIGRGPRAQGRRHLGGVEWPLA